MSKYVIVLFKYPVFRLFDKIFWRFLLCNHCKYPYLLIFETLDIKRKWVLSFLYLALQEGTYPAGHYPHSVLTPRGYSNQKISIEKGTHFNKIKDKGIISISLLEIRGFFHFLS